MSEESAASLDSVPAPAGKPPAKARRTSTPKAKKAAKPKKEESDALLLEVVPTADIPAPDELQAVSAPAAGDEDWPEPEPATFGNQSTGEGQKRKRRRRKGKGQSQQASQEDASSPPVLETTVQPQPQQQPLRPAQQAVQRPKPNPDQHVKMAWKIFLAEVSEEGVALIGDHDAKELARRCFRLAEIFIEEQTRRR